MKINLLLSASLLSSLGCYSQISMPASPQQPVTDTYFGKKVTDHYRWLEDVNNQKTKDWYKAQADYTNSILNQIPGRDSLINTFIKYDALQTSKYSGIMSRANGSASRRYFYRKISASENLGKIYCREGKTGNEVLLFDPKAYDKNKNYSVSGYVPSENGKFLALGIVEGGLEISVVKILNVETKTFLPESIPNVFNAAVTWTPDSKGLIYTPQNSADPADTQGSLNTKVKYHALNTAVEKDIELLSAAKNPSLNIESQEHPNIYYTEDFKHIIASMTTVDSRMNAWIAPAADLLNPDIKWKRFISKKDSVYQAVTVADKMFFYSVKGAPNGKVLVTSASNPDLKMATEAIPESKHVMYAINPSKDYLLITKDDIVKSHFQQYHVSTNRLTDINTPFEGIGGLLSTDPDENDLNLVIHSWTHPTTIYDYDPVKNEAVISPFQMEVKYPGIADLVVEEIEIPSHDGVMVPLSLIYKKGLKKNGSNICFMTGYGAYAVSAVPHFNPMQLALLNKGVIIAETHVRGGGEKRLKLVQSRL